MAPGVFQMASSSSQGTPRSPGGSQGTPGGSRWLLEDSQVAAGGSRWILAPHPTQSLHPPWSPALASCLSQLAGCDTSQNQLPSSCNGGDFPAARYGEEKKLIQVPLPGLEFYVCIHGSLNKQPSSLGSSSCEGDAGTPYRAHGPQTKYCSKDCSQSIQIHLCIPLELLGKG